MNKQLLLGLSFLLALPSLFAATDRFDADQVLPPAPPWSGKTRSLIAAPNDEWITPSETTRLRTSPSYDDTVRWLQKLVAAAPELKMISLGKSSEGRDIWMVIASKERRFTPPGLRQSRKPVVLAQGGIHSGEIDGKDAGMMLLRDMTVRGTRRSLLDRANFLFVPIFNVDGHERSSKFGRINQRGPEVSGWRTTARNLNLNRDYAKADSPEMQAMVRAIQEWNPDLYIDIHVTDGVDYQYDITYGYNPAVAYSPSSTRWLDSKLTPYVDKQLRAQGHVPGPLIGAIDPNDLERGIFGWVAGPRFSTGYGDLRHTPTILVENHSLKPYDQRVLGTYVFLQAVLEAIGQDGAALASALASDRALRPARVALEWGVDPEKQAEMLEFLGIESTPKISPASGNLYLEWSGKPVTQKVPRIWMTRKTVEADRPKAYWVPAVWSEVIARLALHGIEMERIATPRAVDVEMYRLRNPKFGAEPFEGHQTVTATPMIEQRNERFPTGSVRIPTNQRLGDLAMVLLEPASADSFLQWGFFHEIFQRTEYVEDYVMAPLAESMLAADPKLAEEFRKKLASDETFRGSSSERMRWFYERTPYYDQRWQLYPVGREK